MSYILQEQACRLPAAKRSSRSSGAWKYPFLGGPLFLPPPYMGFFLGGGGGADAAGILKSPRVGVAQPSSSIVITASSRGHLVLAPHLLLDQSNQSETVYNQKRNTTRKLQKKNVGEVAKGLATKMRCVF
ncbi:hypothetical protein NL676_032772 [Syzygium grande]|nr:hypothetical protein NL676_032772 [Syzygium grande]